MIDILDIKEAQDGVTFRVRVQPRASKNQLSGIMDGAVKVRLTAPPVDGEANEACLKFFSGLFKVPVSAVKLISGQTGRNKTIKVLGLTAEEVLSRITDMK